MSRIISIVLVIAMLMVTLAGCGGGAASTSDTQKKVCVSLTAVKGSISSFHCPEMQPVIGVTVMPTQLESWNDGAAKRAIVDFVRRVTTANGPDFVPPADRIATFDNDGTLWCEQPLPIHFDFIWRRWVDMARQNPALREQQPWKAAVEKDYAWFGNAVTKHYRGDDSDIPAVMQGVLTAFGGAMTEDFAERAGDFLRTQSHPILKRLYCACGYAPMIELLHYLEASGFTNLSRRAADAILCVRSPRRSMVLRRNA